ncbi:MAG: hypothetical protein NTX91_00695 [candidate division SR1 bacterium]|nr:hypothetical protein [candidate division SR1 bacterium]
MSNNELDSHTEYIDDGEGNKIEIICVKNEDGKRYYKIYKKGLLFNDNTTNPLHNDLVFDDRHDCIESAKTFIQKKFLSL